MSASDLKYENWWNHLSPQQRVEVFRLIPLRSPEQVAVFSSRSWHELHGWMRDNLGKLFVISDADRESLPELGQSYTIALEELSTTKGKAQSWLIPSEAAYDDEVLLALSSVGCPPRRYATSISQLIHQKQHQGNRPVLQGQRHDDPQSEVPNSDAAFRVFPRTRECS